MKRSPMPRRTTPLQSSGWTPGQVAPTHGVDGEGRRFVAMTGRRPLPKVSAKRRKRDEGYGAARMAAFERAGGRCEAQSDVCTGAAEQTHHIAGRLGADPHRLTNLLVVCGSCHDRIHAHPAESLRRGWMRKRNGVAA